MIKNMKTDIIRRNFYSSTFLLYICIFILYYKSTTLSEISSFLYSFAKYYIIIYWRIKVSFAMFCEKTSDWFVTYHWTTHVIFCNALSINNCIKFYVCILVCNRMKLFYVRRIILFSAKWLENTVIIYVNLRYVCLLPITQFTYFH